MRVRAWLSGNVLLARRLFPSDAKGLDPMNKCGVTSDMADEQD